MRLGLHPNGTKRFRVQTSELRSRFVSLKYETLSQRLQKYKEIRRCYSDF